MAAPPFQPALDLNERFFRAVVRPLLARAFPDLEYAAACVGPGSHVLGLDDAVSMDHDWGVGLHLFVNDDLLRKRTHAIEAALETELPAQFEGYPVWFVPFGDGTRVPGGEAVGRGEQSHRIEVTRVDDFARSALGCDVLHELTPWTWLSIPQQSLLEVTGGRVFHDGPGELTQLRQLLAWYPRDLWLHLQGAAWQAIGEAEHLLGRAGERGDELGAMLIAAGIAQDVMRLAFLWAECYAPYPKWFGSCFATLPGALELAGPLRELVGAPDARARGYALARTLEAAARVQNGLALAEPVEPTMRQFHTRAYRVIDGARFAAALVGAIRDPAVRALPLVGNVNQETLPAT